MAERWRRREWLAGAGTVALVTACERTRAPHDTHSPALRCERLAELDGSLGKIRQILVHRPGHALVVTTMGFALVGRTRVVTRLLDNKATPLAVSAPNGFVIGTTRFSWSGRRVMELRTGGLLDGSGRRQLALARVGGDWVTIVQSGHDEEYVLAARRLKTNGAARWRYELPQWGTGAIAPDGRVVLARFDGRVVVLGDAEGEQRSPRLLVDAHVQPPPYAVACDDDGASLLGAPTIPDYHHDNQLRIAATPEWQPETRWTTTVLELDYAGRERWRVDVPFAALQVVRRGTGSVVVAGMGAALVAGGKILWSRTSVDRMHAALAGDDIVLAHGTGIECVDANGRTRATGSIDDGPIACVPAVESSGAIWVATARSVWRGR